VNNVLNFLFLFIEKFSRYYASPRTSPRRSGAFGLTYSISRKHDGVNLMAWNLRKNEKDINDQRDGGKRLDLAL